MPEWIRKRERVTVVEYSRDFDYEGERGWGFSFPCDEQGNVRDRWDPDEPLNPVARGNYAACLTGEVEGRRVVDRGVRREERTYTEPGVIRCDCGAEVVLAMTMTNTCTACTHCGRDEDDEGHTSFTHHDYEACGIDYNSSGQRLAPREQWGWDTGESVSDILMSDWPVDVPREV